MWNCDCVEELFSTKSVLILFLVEREKIVILSEYMQKCLAHGTFSSSPQLPICLRSPYITLIYKRWKVVIFLNSARLVSPLSILAPLASYNHKPKQIEHTHTHTHTHKHPLFSLWFMLELLQHPLDLWNLTLQTTNPLYGFLKLNFGSSQHFFQLSLKIAGVGFFVLVG